MTCVNCTHLTSHRAASQAMYKKEGFGGCKLLKAYEYVSPQHSCTKFVRTTDAQIARRQGWAA